MTKETSQFNKKLRVWKNKLCDTSFNLEGEKTFPVEKINDWNKGLWPVSPKVTCPSSQAWIWLQEGWGTRARFTQFSRAAVNSCMEVCQNKPQHSSLHTRVQTHTHTASMEGPEILQTLVIIKKSGWVAAMDRGPGTGVQGQGQDGVRSSLGGQQVSWAGHFGQVQSSPGEPTSQGIPLTEAPPTLTTPLPQLSVPQN